MRDGSVTHQNKTDNQWTSLLEEPPLLLHLAQHLGFLGLMYIGFFSFGYLRLKCNEVSEDILTELSWFSYLI